MSPKCHGTPPDHDLSRVLRIWPDAELLSYEPPEERNRVTGGALDSVIPAGHRQMLDEDTSS